MTNEHASEASPSRNDSPNFLGSLVVPIAIVLIGGAIIWGVTKMLSTDRSYKDLVREMQSKTFGNRWIAAFELSKMISASQIPQEDVGWLTVQLQELYETATDHRTKTFIVVAIGALKSPNIVPFLEKTVQHGDPDIAFHSLVAIGNMDTIDHFNWKSVLDHLESSDNALKQAAVLTLSTHRVSKAEPVLEGLLGDGEQSIRYSSATGLINFKNQKAIPTLKMILLMKLEQAVKAGLNQQKLYGLKLNIMRALVRNRWTALNDDLAKVEQIDEDPKIRLQAAQTLNELKI